MSDRAETYLNRFLNNREVTLVGPMEDGAPDLREPVIFVDGGSRYRETDIGISIGDGDSSRSEMDLGLDPVKDFSDLSAALRLIDDRFESVLLHGFLGGRRDHELFNLGEAHHFLQGRGRTPGQSGINKCRLRFGESIIAFSAGAWQFERNGLFSLGVLAPTSVSLSGCCEYRIAVGTIVETLSSYGLSNIGCGLIELICDGPVFIFLPKDGD